QQHMTSIGKWSKFQAITMFVVMGLLVLLGVAIVVAPSVLMPSTGHGMVIFTSVLYILFGLLFFIPATFLLVNAKSMIGAGENGSSEEFATAMDYSKRYWKFNGIFLIVWFSLCILILAVTIIGVVM
ncbi:MAG: hypothetical protein II525_02345, partial [Bacteroidales bacterium]|nr:hypothetical protein [Bacteroidales bacterium]